MNDADYLKIIQGFEPAMRQVPDKTLRYKLNYIRLKNMPPDLLYVNSRRLHKRSFLYFYGIKLYIPHLFRKNEVAESYEVDEILLLRGKKKLAIFYCWQYKLAEYKQILQDYIKFFDVEIIKIDKEHQICKTIVEFTNIDVTDKTINVQTDIDRYGKIAAEDLHIWIFNLEDR